MKVTSHHKISLFRMKEDSCVYLGLHFLEHLAEVRAENKQTISELCCPEKSRCGCECPPKISIDILLRMIIHLSCSEIGGHCVLISSSYSWREVGRVNFEAASSI